MIVMTGASGPLGRLVTKGLLKILPAEKIGVSIRNPDDVADFAEQGMRVARAISTFRTVWPRR